MSETSAFRRALCRPDPADKGWGVIPAHCPHPDRPCLQSGATPSRQTLPTGWGHPQQAAGCLLRMCSSLLSPSIFARAQLALEVRGLGIHALIPACPSQCPVS